MQGDEILIIEDNVNNFANENNVSLNNNYYETSNIVYKNYEKDDVCPPNKPIDNKWITERRKNKPSRNKINSYPTVI